MEYLQLVGLIILLYLVSYSIINRICNYIERRVYAKCGFFKETTLQDISGQKNAIYPNKKNKEEN